MKLLTLILILISFNCFADVHISVDSQIKNIVPITSFKDMQKAQPWIDDMIEDDSWGKKERWVNSEKVNDLSKCLEQREVFDDLQDPPVKLRDECKLPKEYSILICDDEQSYSEGHDCKPIVDDMIAKKQEKADKEQELEGVKNIKKLKKKWSELNDNQKDRLIKYLLRNI